MNTPDGAKVFQGTYDTDLGEAWNNLAAVYAATGRKPLAEEAISHAEHAGFRVNPRLKDEIKAMQ